MPQIFVFSFRLHFSARKRRKWQQKEEQMLSKCEIPLELLMSSDSNFIISQFLFTPRCLFMLFFWYFLLIVSWTFPSLSVASFLFSGFGDDDKTGFHFAVYCFCYVMSWKSFQCKRFNDYEMICWALFFSTTHNGKLSSGCIQHKSDVCT